MWTKKPDNITVDITGRPLFIPVEEFKNICLSKRCFICGTSNSSSTFNDEHVFPRWLQKELNLFTKTLTLPNQIKVKYGSYKIRCCKPCNDELGEKYERNVSNLIKNFKHGSNVNQEDNFLIFKWLALIFIKTHLRDRKNPNKLDRSNSDGYIADEYEWPLLHHAHAMVRSKLNDISCHPMTFGTFFTLPFKDPSASDLFDYSDNLFGQSIMLRCKNTCFLQC